MHCPPIFPVCASVTIKSEMRSMQIPVQLIVPSHSMKVVNTWALVDSGADISCIDQHFVRKYNLPTTKLPVPIWARNADHSHNKMETSIYLWFICWYPRTCPKSNPPCHDLWKRKYNSRATVVKESQPHDWLDHANSDPRRIHWRILRSLPTSHCRYNSRPIPLLTHTSTP